MWAKLEAALLDHPKILEAGHRLGKDGAARALGFYTAGLLYTNKYLTEGFLSTGVVAGQLGRFVDRPLLVADVMVQVKLWDPADGGFQIHDYHDQNDWVKGVMNRRKSDRDRKRRQRGHDAD